MSDEQPKRRGRPLKAPDLQKRHHQTFRVREHHRSLLQTAAAENERSISEEVEARIEKSFDELALGEEIITVVNVVRAMMLVCKIRNKDRPWTNSQADTDEAYWAAVDALTSSMNPTHPCSRGLGAIKNM